VRPYAIIVEVESLAGKVMDKSNRKAARMFLGSMIFLIVAIL
jgi:hypothetical protein